MATTAGVFASGKALLYRELNGTWVRGPGFTGCLGVSAGAALSASFRWLEAEGGKGA